MDKKVLLDYFKETTDSLKEICLLELDSASEKLKYSSGIAVFATAGLALLFSNGENIMDNSAFYHNNTKMILMISVIVLSISVMLNILVMNLVFSFKNFKKNQIAASVRISVCVAELEMN